MDDYNLQMNSYSQNNKRIAKNTMMLYVRLLFTMVISLYTSRIILKTLGVEDFGTFTIIGGLVTLFSFLNNAMTTSTQRFLNFELGKNNLLGVRRIFSMSMTAHLSICLLILILAETIGLWFMNEKMNIPAERLTAANWLYQFSLLTFCAKVIRTPHQASVIAYEKFPFYAYIGIIEVLLSLISVFILNIISYDKLIIYGALLFGVSIIINFVYYIYCRLKIDICRYQFFWDKKLYWELMSFSGWSLFGSVANVGAQQGINILLNIFYGVVVNAAMGIANQVTAAVNSFVSNFQLAFNPQIIKSYSSGNKEYFMSLVFRTSKYSYFLLFIISLPLILSMDYVLYLWLGDVPEYAATFCILMLIFCLTDAISAPLWMSVQAVGKIRNYQIIISIIIILNLPLSYLALKFNYPAESVLFIRIFINIIAFFFRIIYLQKKIQFNVWLYFKDVIFKILLVSLISVALSVIVKNYISENVVFVFTTIFSVLITGLAIYILGLNQNERTFLKQSILNRIKR